ncbi:redox-regulated ATPase YchF [Candidatus Peribacteria bacterium]|nr:redox-regulated ATPase YchF [Candidatus Peribacteria bacterium]
MALRIGIVGLPNVGKSTLFNALTGSRGAPSANYPFCTIDPNVGIVAVPDERLLALAELVHPAKVIPAAVEFVDIAGLVKGASKGEGLGNQFLAAIREVHAICHVVRAFLDGNVVHVDGSIEPKRDRETIETELILADMETILQRIEKTQGPAKTGNAEKQQELTLLMKYKHHLENAGLAATLVLAKEEHAVYKRLPPLLTAKPILYAINVSEEQLANSDPREIKKEIGLTENEQLVLICAKIEEDLQDLTPDERREYLADIQTDSGLSQLIRAAYDALGYITFFTAGPQEVRAWNIVRGSTAPEAAGVIHTDFQRGFIRAETIAYADYVRYGGEQKAKEAGKLRSEGKDYIVQDGDVMHFRFNT